MMKYILIWILFIFFCMPAYAEEEAEKDVADVKVVSTLKELQTVPAIPIKGGWVRLGISGKSAPLGSGVVLYCLWEGTKWPGYPKEFSGSLIGPLAFQIVNTKLLQGQVKVIYRRESEIISPSIFMTTIPACREGKNVYNVFSPTKKPLAVFELEGTKPVAQAWIQFPPARGWNVADSLEVLPSINGIIPIKQKNTKGLPRLIPEAVGGLRLSIKKKLFKLSADIPMRTRIDRCVMMHIWINGKPLMWIGKKKLLDDVGIEGKEKEISRDLNWYTYLGKTLISGDKVEVQALYNEFGWVNTYEGDLAHASRFAPYTEPLLSNKASFIYSVGEGTLRKGAFYDKWTDTQKDGQLLCKGKFKSGKRTGKWTWWYENGIKQSEGRFKAGEKTGRWRYYDNNGGLITENKARILKAEVEKE